MSYTEKKPKQRVFGFADLCLLTGFGAFEYGLWTAWEPLAFVAGGFFLIVYSAFAARVP